jgi:hypothetical protein
MLGKQHIVPSLQALDAAYQNTSGPDAERFAKLAIIELCGWIEEAMDEVMNRCSRRHLGVQDNLDYCAKKIVETTYGFEYERHFRFMLIRLVGIVGVEKIESQVNSAKHIVLKSTLKTLVIKRNTAAHTHLKGATATFDAPSVTLANFHHVYDGLLDLSRTMRRVGW